MVENVVTCFLGHGVHANTTCREGDDCRPDIKAQQQCNEDAGNDNVTETEHSEVVRCEAFLQQVLREHHYSTQNTMLIMIRTVYFIIRANFPV